MPLQTSQVLLNKYRIEQLVGEGTFGYVYRATDLVSQRPVAIKQLRPELGYESDAFRRFLREAQATRSIHHPNIVSSYALERSGDSYFLISDFMDGGNLADLLRLRGALMPVEAINITLMILSALATVHRHGIVHRDLKPSNILFSHDGCAKLCDFGIARIPIPGEQSLTQSGTVMGTANYMSPEQARGDKVDARSDLYGVGAMLYEMLAGHPYLAFKKSLLYDLELVLTTQPLPLPPSVPRDLVPLVLKALEKSREKRFQSADAMRASLTRTFNKLPSTPERLRATEKRIPGYVLVALAIAIVLALVLLAAVVGLVLLLR
jgi:serine/threonine protein kinase